MTFKVIADIKQNIQNSTFLILVLLFSVSANASHFDILTDKCADKLNAHLESRKAAGRPLPSAKVQDWYMWYCQTASSQSQETPQKIPVKFNGSSELPRINFVSGCMMAKSGQGLSMADAYLFCLDLFEKTF